MNARIAGGLIASPTKTLSHLPASASDCRDPGSHAIAVGRRSFEQNRDEMVVVVGPVVQIDEGLVLSHDDGVEPPVIVKVADGKPTPKMERAEWWAGSF